MILRFKTEEEVTALQQRIKGKSVRVHMTELRSNTGTITSKEWLAAKNAAPQESTRVGSFDGPCHQTSGALSRSSSTLSNAVAAPLKTPSKTLQKRLRARKPENWSRRLLTQCQALKLPIPSLEYLFHPVRRWRFDCVWVEAKIAVEIEGGLWVNGRHNRAQGFLADMMKYNEATRLGWRVYRFSPSQVKKGMAVLYVGRILRESPH